METVIIKIALSSAVLLVFYYLFLAKLRTFGFNRLYLITSLIFSYSVPFISVPSIFKVSEKPNLIFGEPLSTFQQVKTETAEIFDWTYIVLAIYILISTLLLIKFVCSISKIKLLRGETISYQNHKIVVLEKDYAPFSFLKTVYIGKKYFNQNEIDERIFMHEKCHVTQNHSLDILFVEFLKIISWFNPAIYLYKSAMITNHEFLADEFVLKTKSDVSSYQHLILNEITSAQNLKLTHQFDFNNTKKRFIMMTTKNSRFTAIRKMAILPLLAVLFLFVSKTIQAKTDVPPTLVVNGGKIEQQITKSVIKPAAAILSEKDVLEIKNEIVSESDTAKNKINPPAAAAANAESAVKEFSGILPQFPGGINEFRKLVVGSFDTSVLNANVGILRTTIFVEIDENGKMGTISADGANAAFNGEAIRSVGSVKNKIWTPATENGVPVKYVFKMPLTMSFSGEVPAKP